MKKINMFQLAVKNLLQNFSRSILPLISIIFLGAAIMVLSNLYYNTVLNLESEARSLLSSGVKMYVSKEDKISFTDDEINKFLEDAEAIGYTKYELNVQNSVSTASGEFLSIYPYIIGKTDKMIPILLCEGNENDLDGNYIFLDKETAEKSHLTIGDSIALKIDGEEQNFIIKGTLYNKESFIDLSYLNVTYLTVYSETTSYDNLEIYDKLIALRDMTDYADIGCAAIDYYDSKTNFSWMILGVTSFLTLLCIALSMGCIINSLKISVEENEYALLMMKALGMKDKDIFNYIITQQFFILLLGTIISSIFALIIIKLTLGAYIEILLKVVQIHVNIEKTKFVWFVPFINFVLLAISEIIGASVILKHSDFYGKIEHENKRAV